MRRARSAGMRDIVAAAIAGAVSLGLLNGCTTAGAVPDGSTSPASALDLLPTVWHVHGAAGADPATYLLFHEGEAEVLEPGGYVVTDWETQGATMMATVSTWANSLHLTRKPEVPWLTSATRFVHAGRGFALLDS